VHPLLFVRSSYLLCEHLAEHILPDNSSWRTFFPTSLLSKSLLGLACFDPLDSLKKDSSGSLLRVLPREKSQEPLYFPSPEDQFFSQSRSVSLKKMASPSVLSHSHPWIFCDCRNKQYLLFFPLRLFSTTLREIPLLFGQ